jgi:hypothetical protein
LTQPVKGWTAAESLLPGSKNLPSMTKGAKWARKQRAMEETTAEKERGYLSNTFGDISRFFLRLSGSLLLIPGKFVSPDFNNPEGNKFFKQLNNDVERLKLWSQKNKPDLATPWENRVDSLLRLLEKQRRRATKLNSKLGDGMVESGKAGKFTPRGYGRRFMCVRSRGTEFGQ